MKRNINRGEHLQFTVNQYLKRRQYMEVHGDVGLKKESSVSVTGHGNVSGNMLQSVEGLVLAAAVITESSLPDTIAYSAISGDAMACDQQYSRFRLFIKEINEPHQIRLQSLLYPLFIHVYLELLCNGQKIPAHKFYSRHHESFWEDPQRQPVLEALQHMNSKEDVFASKTVTQFREHKYTILLHADTVDFLFRYLKGDDNVLLLQLFNRHIDLVVQGLDVQEDVEQQEERLTESCALVSPPITPENKVIHNDVSLSKLQACIRKVREGPPCMPSVCLYTVLNTYEGMCSASISEDHAVLCSGFEDSSVRVWSLTPKQLKLASPVVNISQIHMAGDLTEDLKQKNKVNEFDEVETFKLLGHSGTVHGTAFLQDHRYVLSASEDTTVRLWDLNTGTNIVIYKGHNYPVWDVVTSPGNSYFATGSHDRTARLWCTDRIFPIRSFIGHLSDVNTLTFHPNGSYLATGSGDHTVRLWKLTDGKPVRLLQGHRAAVHALTFSPNGQLLASAGEDRRVRVWELISGRLLCDLYGHSDVIHSLAFNSTSNVLASGGMDGMLRLWDITKSGSGTSSSSSSERHSAPQLMTVYPTKNTILHHLKYMPKNLLLAVGSHMSS